ncbi:MAG: UPF0262 family protein [Hyphomicrobiaceae bacterium]
MTSECSVGAPARDRLFDVSVDPSSIARGSNDSVEHERKVAIYDLLERNSFALEGVDEGPYRLVLATQDDKLLFNIHNADRAFVTVHSLSLSPLKRIMRDYFIVCDSYYQAMKSAPPSRLQAIDQGRRALHDEASEALAERLQGKIALDHDTARRLFTLICSLHWKG